MPLDPWPAPTTVYRMGAPTLGAPLFEVGPPPRPLSWRARLLRGVTHGLRSLRRGLGRLWAWWLGQTPTDVGG